MPETQKGLLGDPDVSSESIRQAWEQASLEALESHRRMNVPVATWDYENNKVLLVSPDEYPRADDLAIAAKPASNSDAR